MRLGDIGFSFEEALKTRGDYRFIITGLPVYHCYNERLLHVLFAGKKRRTFRFLVESLFQKGEYNDAFYIVCKVKAATTGCLYSHLSPELHAQAVRLLLSQPEWGTQKLFEAKRRVATDWLDSPVAAKNVSWLHKTIRNG